MHSELGCYILHLFPTWPLRLQSLVFSALATFLSLLFSDLVIKSLFGYRLHKSKMYWKPILAVTAALTPAVNAAAQLRFSCSQLVVERLDP